MFCLRDTIVEIYECTKNINSSDYIRLAVNGNVGLRSEWKREGGVDDDHAAKVIIKKCVCSKLA